MFGANETCAQNQLERVSIAERADGLGYVVRFHLTAPVDSFALAQPETGRVELALFGDGLSHTDLNQLYDSGLFQSIRQLTLNRGIGFVFHHNEDEIFFTGAYPDQNGRDLLLSLERRNANELIALISGEKPLDWAALGADDSDVSQQEEESPERITTEKEPIQTPVREDDTPDKTDQIPETQTAHQRQDTTDVSDHVTVTQTVQQSYALYPGDPMELYLRWATTTPLNRHLHYSGSAISQSTIQTPHPWQHHNYFSSRNLWDSHSDTSRNLQRSRPDPSGNL
ncbi:MAG: hypothetical protein WD355_00615, partial [Balneolaceae bacterium]